jgi:hypothetical protein
MNEQKLDDLTYFSFLQQVELEIILGFAHINNVRVNLREDTVKVMNKRFNKSTKHLDLSNFHRDPGMTILTELSPS